MALTLVLTASGLGGGSAAYSAEGPAAPSKLGGGPVATPAVHAEPAEAPAATAPPTPAQVPGVRPTKAPPAGGPDTVPGRDQASSLGISGESGQDVAANFPEQQSGPEPPTTVARDLWWTWTAPRAGQYVFRTHGSEVDTVLTVLQGPPGALTEVVSNDDDGDVSTSSVVLDARAGETYRIRVRSKDGDAGLITLSWYLPSDFYIGGQQQDARIAGSFDDIPTSVNTGEKPQSKVWQSHGTWWAVLASTGVSPAGTWIWRYDPSDGTWSNVLRVSGRTDVRGDVKVVGDVAHILLHGPSSSLVSVEYDQSADTYRLWDDRPTATSVSLPGSETATIDIDSTGRMWLAADTSSSIQVRYSDAPYGSFSAPVTVASGIADDDIGLVVALPKGRIGVLWSNQNTKRFGFRTHLDNAAPGTWAGAEVPAADSALNIGKGMADDHLNVAVSADGTIYAAVKTSYDSANATTIGLLVRRPNGTWDPLYEVDRVGTRGIVLLDDDADLLRVVYTESTNFDDILEKRTSTQQIDFDDDPVEVLPDDYNNVTSTKANYSGDVMVMAASETTTRSALLTDRPLALPSTVATVVDEPVDGTLQASAVGTPVFEIVDTPDRGAVVLTDPVAGAFTYTPDSGVTGTDSFTFRVGVGGTWSDPAQVSVVIESGTGLRGEWLFDEGAGSAAGDSSGWGNNGTVVGAPAWGGAGEFVFTGSNYVRVPDNPSLDIQDALTVAAWVRPDGVRTQYIVKKDSGSANGYELSLSSAGKPFFRLNLGSSGDKYRVNAASAYPSDGDTWMHVAGTYDGSTMRIYVNGVLEASVAGPSSIGVNALELALGAEPGGTRKYQGGMGGVRLYDRALSATQVAALADPETAPTPPPTAENSSISTEAGEAVSATLSGSAPGTPVFQVVDQPDRGSVTITDASSGAFTYTPSGGAIGTDAFTFRVGSGGTWSAPATVTVTVEAPGRVRGAWLFGEGAGAAVADSSGWANDGTVVGAALWGAPGEFVWNGSNHIRVPDAAALDVTSALTLSAWVRPEAVVTQYVVKKATSSTNGYELGLSSGGRAFLRFNRQSSGDTYRVNATSAYPADGDTWVHLAGTYDGSTMRIYVNGVLEASVAGPSSIGVNALELALGAEPGGAGRFRGGMGGVHVYARSLSAAEIAALADPSTAPAQVPTALAGSVSTVVGTPVDGDLEGTSFSGGPLVFDVVDEPGLGSVVITDASTGAFTYTPNPGIAGTDAFTFRVGQGSLWSAPATVTVTIDAVGGLRGQWLMGEGAGTTVGDDSGWGNHGTFVGGAAWGVPGEALFTGSNYIRVPDSASIGVREELTVSAWVRPEAVATQYVVKKGTSSTNGFELGLSSGGRAFLRLNRQSWGDTYRVNATSAYPADGDTWVHLAGTYDGSTIRIYVNGVLEASAAGPGSVGANALELAIGAESGGAAGRFRGGMGAVQVYGRALSAAEVADLAAPSSAPGA